MKTKYFAVAFCLIGLQGCVGTVVGAASSAVIEVAKIPFKVVGAVVEGVSGSETKEDRES